MASPIDTRQRVETLNRVIQDAVDDGNIDSKESQSIRAHFDIDGDKRLSTRDLKEIPVAQFESHRSILKRHGFDLFENRVPQKISVSSFADYHPKAAQGSESFLDPLFKLFLTEEPVSFRVGVTARGRPLAPSPDAVRIQNEQSFTEHVLSVAEELGYDKERIATLSIHDAVLLAGRITKHRLSYNHRMIGTPEKAFKKMVKEEPAAAVLTIVKSALSGEKLAQSEEARRVDALPHDVIFEGGAGICRNYAPVNAAVFKMLKKFNPNLVNTTITTFSPEDLGAGLSLPHAWNIVTTLNADGVAYVTYVDPTWFDTRDRRTQAKDGSVLHDLQGDERLYNAYDAAHFGSGLYRNHQVMARLFENAAASQRVKRSNEFGTSEAVLKAYRHEAFVRRFLLANLFLTRLDQGTVTDAGNRQAVKEFVVINFFKMLEDVYGISMKIFSKYGIKEAYFEASNAQTAHLRKLYKRIKQDHPDILSMKVADYASLVPTSINDIHSKLDL
jgi:hypothetical protein